MSPFGRTMSGNRAGNICHNTNSQDQLFTPHTLNDQIATSDLKTRRKLRPPALTVTANHEIALAVLSDRLVLAALVYRDKAEQLLRTPNAPSGRSATVVTTLLAGGPWM